VILAGDIGGTNTRLALFDPARLSEPESLEIYSSADYGGLAEIVKEYLAAHPAEPRASSFGVAGPIKKGRFEGTNLAWQIDAAELGEELGFSAVLLNDLEANAWGIELLEGDDLVDLQPGEPDPGGVIALVSAGTGLGEAYVTGEGVHASEGGHVDFGPRGDLQRELLEFMQRDHEHVSYELVCSGLGIVNCFRFLLARASLPEPDWFAEAGDKGSAISKAGLEVSDETASAALDLMIDIYGAQCGNVALTLLASGGVYLGGGIPPNILPRLREGGFLSAFNSKGRLSEILGPIPVRVITNELTALLGAARHASSDA
jgi:glucokinase